MLSYKIIGGNLVDKSPEKIQKMFDEISEKYDFLNNLMSFGTQIFIKKDCINQLSVEKPCKILDLCCGTGDLTRILRRKYKYAEVFGTDFSEKMLEIAKTKNNKIEYLQSDVTNLTFEDNSFDIITIGFGLRNIENFYGAIDEIYRVLKPKGQIMHLDFGEKNILNKIFDKITPNLIRFFTKNNEAYSYLIKSKQEFFTPEELIKIFEGKGLKCIKRKDYLFKTISCQVLKKITAD